MKPPARKPRRGVTLIELAIVLAVLAVLGALALPSLAARLDRQRLAGAAEALVSDLNEARFEAARRQRSLHLLATPGEAWCWAVAQDPGCPCGSGSACELRHAGPRDHPGIKLLSADALRLDATGTASGSAGLVLESRRGERLRVETPMVGRARVCVPATGGAAALRYPPC